ncbi:MULTISPECIES: VOC family protein [unclassified Sphingomonas]|uniref:VOC family protein n=1 Tax=unclassified Sphingomonas TaxID=196159 RepID=UPI00226A8A43|nr:MULTISPECIES: VOC family protein [unclassified Sphingomonas]
MAILGIESVIYGVEDLDLCNRFWNDYGLTRIDDADDGSIWEVESGSRLIMRAIDDPTLAPAHFPGSGVRECILGVDTRENLEQLVLKVAADREVRRDADGTAHFLDPDGNCFGLRVWNKRPVLCRPDAVNAPDAIVRLNQQRKWRLRACPKTINHIVYFSDDYVAAYEFYRDRLGFRMSDHSKANGIFARPDGTYEHHTLFWLTTQHPGTRNKRGYAHIAFGVEDLDEIMVGANYMQDKGWSNVRPYAAALNRHRISSALYYYFPCPAGGDAEYHADSDYLDDGWVPRVWEMAFGATMWGSSSPGFFGSKGITYDVKLDPDETSLEEFRHYGKADQPADSTR